jgi:Protein of unknown function (DUF1549)
MNPRDRWHWAFRLAQTPPIPGIQSAAVQNPIDAFLLVELERKKLSFSPQADRITLLRRACFDLIGLTPTPEEIDQFLGGPVARRLRKGGRSAPGKHPTRRARHWLDVAGEAADVVRTKRPAVSGLRHPHVQYRAAGSRLQARASQPTLLCKPKH